MFAIDSSSTRAFVDALQCPISVCAPLPANTTLVCGPAVANFAFILCDNPTGPILSIENVPLSGTINGPLFASMGDVWVGLLLVNTSLTGTIPSELVQLPNLRFLRLENNLLTGALPSEPSGAAMQDLRVTRNMLTGTIPKLYLVSMPSIVRLHFGENRFTGSLPAVGVYPQYLNNFFANSNALSGVLPTRLSLWSSPGKWFTVGSNRLTGSLPSDIFSTSKDSFAYFHVDNNFLSGTVPSDLAKQTNLQGLNLSHNSFSGALILPMLTSSAHCFVGYNSFLSCAQAIGFCCVGFDATQSAYGTSRLSLSRTATDSTVLFAGTTTSESSWHSLETFALTTDTPVSTAGGPFTYNSALVGGIVGGIIALLILIVI
jgi:hypothetical protein